MDALRGLTVAAMLLVNNAGDWSHVHPWLAHAPWHGFAPPDLVFPLFLFIMGVSITLGLAAPLARGDEAHALARKALGRALRIVLLGLALHAVAWLALEPRPFRPMGVLQRIGVCYGAAALLAIYLRPKGQWTVLAGLLLLHGAFLWWGGSLAPWVNLSDRLDTLLLGPHAYRFDAASGSAHDPEGPLGTLSALAGTLLGVRAGQWLLQGRSRQLALAALAALALGAAWSGVQPINKNLWTPSFALWAGGLSLLLLLLAHRWVDLGGRPPLGRSMGRNAITAYALAWLAAVGLAASGAMPLLYGALFAAPLQAFAPWVPSAAYALAFTTLVWALMRWFEHRGWRITI